VTLGDLEQARRKSDPHRLQALQQLRDERFELMARLAQLPDDIKHSVFGNVGSRAVFRVGQEDAEFLEKQFAPVFSAKDIVGLSNRNAYVKLLANGEPVPPFNIETLMFPPGDAERAMKIRNAARAKYGKPRAEVEAAIAAKFKKPAATHL